MKNYNILILVIDALRGDFYRISQECITKPSTLPLKFYYFKYAYTAINATDPSLTSMLSGFYPSSTGLVQHGLRVKKTHLRLLGKVRFLQEVLREEGYETIALDFLDRWHSKGFSRYMNPRRYSLKATIFRMLPKSVKGRIVRAGPIGRVAGIPYSACEAVDAAVRLVRRIGSKRFFLFVHFWDTHIPYYTDKYYIKIKKFGDLRVVDVAGTIKGPWGNKLIEVFGDTLVDEVISRYYSAGVYVHRQLRRLLEEVDVDKTIIVITADHGESLGEHGIWFDHHGLYEVTIRVPLLVHVPNGDGGIIPIVYQHVDLTPTLLSLLNLRRAIDPLADGFDLSGCFTASGRCPNNRIVFAEEWYVERKYAIIDEKIRYKFIYAPDPREALCRYCGVVHGALKELYNLREDPGESHNLADIESSVAGEMEDKLKAFVRKLLGKKVRLSLRGSV